MKKTKIPTTRRLRTISQGGVFLLIVGGLVATNHYLAEIGKEMPIVGTASLHAICPYGGIETIVSLVTMGVFVQKIHMSSVVLTALIVLLGLLFGPVVCSYICPLGTVQEWIGKIGKKLFGKHYNQMVPKKLDAILRYLRYGVLIFTVYLTTNSLKLIFLEVDPPYYALFNFGQVRQP